MKKILFCNPAFSNVSGYNRIAPLNLVWLASYFERNRYECEFIDEFVETIDFNKDCDIVFISIMTLNSFRGYVIAQEFKKRGKIVIFGGIHSSLIPEEALKYSDSVVIGEFEGIVEELKVDLKNNKLKKLYKAEWIELKGLPLPRRDLYKKKYDIITIQTSRGCPMYCEFCSVTSFNGGRYRFRPIYEIKKEISKIDGDLIFFCDDNMYGFNRDSIKRNITLFNELRQFNKSFFVQSSINIANDDNALKAFARAGVKVLYIGIESINEESLKIMRKGINLKIGVKNYCKLIKNIHRHGIAVMGSFIMGADGDTLKTLWETLRFSSQINIDIPTFNVLKPFPGTKLYERLKNQNRLLYTNYPNDWKYYDNTYILFKPERMSVKELRENLYQVSQEAFKTKNIFLRSFRTIFSVRSIPTLRLCFLTNVSFKNIKF